MLPYGSKTRLRQSQDNIHIVALVRLDTRTHKDDKMCDPNPTRMLAFSPPQQRGEEGAHVKAKTNPNIAPTIGTYEPSRILAAVPPSQM